MKLEVYRKGIYQIIKIHEELNIISDLSELKYLVRGYVSQGRVYIALSFTDASYIYSGAIAVLMNIYKELSVDEGELCLIEPNTDLKKVFKYLQIDKILKIFESEDSLPAAQDSSTTNG